MSKFNDEFRKNATTVNNTELVRSVDIVNHYYKELEEFCEKERISLTNRMNDKTNAMFTKKLNAWSEFWDAFDNVKNLYNFGIK